MLYLFCCIFFSHMLEKQELIYYATAVVQIQTKKIYIYYIALKWCWHTIFKHHIREHIHKYIYIFLRERERESEWVFEMMLLLLFLLLVVVVVVLWCFIRHPQIIAIFCMYITQCIVWSKGFSCYLYYASSSSQTIIHKSQCIYIFIYTKNYIYISSCIKYGKSELCDMCVFYVCTREINTPCTVDR